MLESDQQQPTRPYPVRAYTALVLGQRFFWVLFNETLQTVVGADIGNWTWVWQNRLYVSNSVDIAAKLVKLRPLQGAPVPGPDRISFSPPPFDVRAAVDDVPAAPFFDFPIT